jgi:predicted phage tail protein
MVRENTAVGQPRTGLVNRQADVARNGINLKFGERINGVTITLAAGAASLRGRIKQPLGETLAAKLYLYLVPAEKENSEDVLRFFTTAVQADGSFAFNNLPPGRYLAVARQAPDSEPQSETRLRAVEEGETRLKIRHAAQAEGNEVEFKPCQNVIDYQLPFKLSSVKN